MNKTGYFQTLWMFIWINLIKNSKIYRTVLGAYNYISKGWRQSFVTNCFRKRYLSEDVMESSVFARIFKFPFTFLTYLQKEYNVFFTSQKERSLLIRGGKYLLHNALALNLRFLGVLMVSASASYFITNLISGRPLKYAIAGLISGLIFAVFDVNITSYFRGSILVRFIERCLGTEVSFNFFYLTKCTSNSRFYSAVFFGVIAGLIAGVKSPILGIGLILGLVFVFLVLYKVEFGICAVVFLAPIVPTMAVAGLSLLCLFSLIVKAVTSKSFEWKYDGIGFLLVSLIAVYLMSAITSYSMMKSIQIWAIYFVFMSLYFVVINTIKTKKQLVDILTIFVVSGLFVCVYGILQYIFGWDTKQAWMDEGMFEDIKMRIYSTLENPNVLGEYILLVLPVSAGLIWVKKNPLSKLVFTAISGVLFAALILTYSRGCWIGVMVSAAIFITFVCGKIWGLALIGLPLLPMVLPESILNRFTSIGNMGDSSTSYRVYIWMGTLAMIKDFWISGIGMGSEAFAQVYPFYSYSSIVAPHSHNLFLQVLVESGVVGILVFMLIVFFLYKNLFTGHQIHGKGSDYSTIMVAIGAALSGFLVQGMFDNSFYNYRVFAIFWLFIAFAMACVYIARNEKSKEEAGDTND